MLRLYSILAAACTLLVGTGCDQRLEQGNLTDFGRFGRSTSVYGSTVLVGAYQEDGQRGAAYLFDLIGGMGPRSRLIPSDPGGNNQFGDDVAIWGNHAVVSAPQANLPGAVRAGAVYVFQKSGTEWLEVAKLTPPAPEAWQGFGIDVAIEGNTLVAGSPSRDQAGAANAGAAYVFQKSADGWSYLTTLSAPSPRAGDNFGSSVAVHEGRVFVGALNRDQRRSQDAGAVYVYQPTARSPYALQQTLTAGDAHEGDRFGAAIAIDSVGTTQQLLIGAPSLDTAGYANAGAAYTYTSSGGTFSLSQKLLAGDPATGAGFGRSVAILTERVAIGASGLASQRGAGYVFERSGGTYSEVAKLSVDDTQINDLVGIDVAAGPTGILLGAMGTAVDPAHSNAGAVHWFSGSGSNWSEAVRLTATEGNAGDSFGRDVEVSSGNAAVASAISVDTYRRDSMYWSLTQQLPPPTDYFPQRIALDGDQLAVFSKRQLRLPLPIGVLELYTLTGSGEWVVEAELVPPLDGLALPNENANGIRLALQNDTLLLGAPRNNGGDGKVVVYRKVGGVWSQAQVLVSEFETTNFDMNFGRSVAIDGNVLIVGENPSSGFPDPTLPTHGKVHVYDLDDGLFALTETITAAVPANLDRFVKALAFSGDHLAIVDADFTLHLYTRSEGVFAETWTLALTGMGPFRPSLDFDGDRLAVGAAGADYSGLTDAGEVRIYLISEGVGTLERTERPTDPANGNSVGTEIAFDGGRLLAATDFSPRTTVYSF